MVSIILFGVTPFGITRDAIFPFLVFLIEWYTTSSVNDSSHRPFPGSAKDFSSLMKKRKFNRLESSRESEVLRDDGSKRKNRIVYQGDNKVSLLDYIKCDIICRLLPKTRNRPGRCRVQ